jgi:hypothetical protein
MKDHLYDRLVDITRKWWLYSVLSLLFFLPAYTADKIQSRDAAKVVIEVLSGSLIYSFSHWFWIFKLVPILILFAIFIFRKNLNWLFNYYSAVIILIIAIFQNMAFNTPHGFALLTGNSVIYIIVAIFWFWEALLVKKNEYRFNKMSVAYWTIPLAFLAFWFPLNEATMTLNFNLLLIFYSVAGITYCLITPTILTVLLISYPNINIPLFRISSFAGLFTGVLTFIQFFFLNSGLFWMGILHLPLLIISAYAFFLSMGTPKHN